MGKDIIMFSIMIMKLMIISIKIKIIMAAIITVIITMKQWPNKLIN